MKFILENSWLLAIIVLSGGALLWPALQRRGAKLSALQATQLINQGKALLLDVRSADDFAAGHLRDSKNIPLAELAQRTGEIEKFKDKPVIVICSAGVRSAKAAAQLKHAGFGNVASLNGGLSAWQAQGLPVTR